MITTRLRTGTPGSPTRQPPAATVRHRHVDDRPGGRHLRDVPGIDCEVVAMNDAGRRHNYGDRVRFEIAESDLASYRRAADFLNVGATDVLCLQHEYGIFGGKAGSHVLALLGEVRMPIVTTLHTILSEPTAEQRRVMDEVTRFEPPGGDESRRRRAFARRPWGAGDKIDFIPHGIPILPSSRRARSASASRTSR